MLASSGSLSNSELISIIFCKCAQTNEEPIIPTVENRAYKDHHMSMGKAKLERPVSIRTIILERTHCYNTSQER